MSDIIGKHTIDQVVFGGILFAISAIFIIPSAIGVSEYVTQKDLAKDAALEQKQKAYYGVQVFFVVLACIGVVAGIVLMATAKRSVRGSAAFRQGFRASPTAGGRTLAHYRLM